MNVMWFMLRKALLTLFCFILFAMLYPGQADGKTPGVSAQSAALIDQSSGRLLYGKNSHEKLPIASITKVMTAILAIESGKMNKRTTVSAEAIRTEGSSIYLKAGEKIKLRDLVYGLMLRSGNDASRAIAEAVGQSEQGFVFMMNEKAKEIGMTDTHFTNPNGLENTDHYSSAYDMALLTRYAMQHPLFRKIVGTRIYRAAPDNKSEARVWGNKNKMLKQYKYATGGKTGFTKAAGRTLISTATKGKMDLIAVTLNDGDDWVDHRNLFEWGFQTFKNIQVVRKGRLHADVSKFYKNKIFVKRSMQLPLTTDEKRSFTKKLILLAPPKSKKGWTPPEPTGRILITVHGEKLGSLPVYYQQGKPTKKGFWSAVRGFFGAIISGEGADNP